jgi:hypothetical protein
MESSPTVIAPSSLGAWLQEPPAKRRRSQLPVSAVFEAVSTDTTSLLPYAPEDLQCCICFVALMEWLLDYGARDMNVYSCPTGHLFCEACWRKVWGKESLISACPSCRCTLESAAPVPLLKRLAAGSLSLCPLGCGALLSGAQRRHHFENVCPQRLVACPHCHHRCAVKSLREHIVEKHEVLLQATVQLCGRRRKGSGQPNYCKTFLATSPKSIVYLHTLNVTCLDRVEDTKETFLDFVVMLDLWRLDESYAECAKGSALKIRATFPYATSAENVVERVVAPGTLRKQEFLLVIPPFPPEPLETQWSVLLEMTDMVKDGSDSQEGLEERSHAT